MFPINLQGLPDAAKWLGKAALGNVAVNVRFVGLIVVDGPGPADGHLTVDTTVKLAMGEAGPTWDVLPGSQVKVTPGLPTLPKRNPG